MVLLPSRRNGTSMPVGQYRVSVPNTRRSVPRGTGNGTSTRVGQYQEGGRAGSTGIVGSFESARVQGIKPLACMIAEGPGAQGLALRAYALALRVSGPGLRVQSQGSRV
eukprot:1425612-Rhodomonas_salina.3